MVVAANSWCSLACRHTTAISLPPCPIISFLSLCLIGCRHHLIKYGLISTFTLITSVKILVPNKVRHSEVLDRHEFWGNIIQPTPWPKTGQPHSPWKAEKSETICNTFIPPAEFWRVCPLPPIIDIPETSLVPFAWVSYYSESPSFCAWPNISPITPHVT